MDCYWSPFRLNHIRVKILFAMGLSHPLAGKTMAEVGKAKWSLPNSILVHFDITINNTWFKNETFGQKYLSLKQKFCMHIVHLTFGCSDSVFIKYKLIVTFCRLNYGCLYSLCLLQLFNRNLGSTYFLSEPR